MPLAHSPRQPTILIGSAVFTSALAVAILRVTTLSQLFGVRLRMPWTMNDFKTAIYCPVAIFLQGGTHTAGSSSCVSARFTTCFPSISLRP